MSDRREDGKQLLKQVADFLNVNDMESKHVWAILTALRGPDNVTYDSDSFDSPSLKDATTAKVRFAFGIREGVGNGATVSSVAPDLEDASLADDSGWSGYGESNHVITKYEDFDASRHFLKHYSWAVRALAYFGLIN